MGRWSRDEIEEASDKYQEASLKGASTQDWDDWVNCFTEDATYIEHQDGNFWGRASIKKWITELMAPWPINEMTVFPMRWYTIDEDKGWVICEVRNRMNDLGDGKLYEETNMTTLHYAGKGLFSCQIDMYNPGNFARMIAEWVGAKLTMVEPEERERLSKELEKTMKAREEVAKKGIRAAT